jgi:serine/threonine protein kinase
MVKLTLKDKLVALTEQGKEIAGWRPLSIISENANNLVLQVMRGEQIMAMKFSDVSSDTIKEAKRTKELAATGCLAPREIESGVVRVNRWQFNYMVMPLYAVSLYDYIMHNNPKPGELFNVIFVGENILEELACLHSRGFAHGFITPRDIMYDGSTRRWTLVDFKPTSTAPADFETLRKNDIDQLALVLMWIEHRADYRPGQLTPDFFAGDYVMSRALAQFIHRTMPSALVPIGCLPLVSI